MFFLCVVFMGDSVCLRRLYGDHTSWDVSLKAPFISFYSPARSCPSVPDQSASVPAPFAACVMAGGGAVVDTLWWGQASAGSNGMPKGHFVVVGVSDQLLKLLSKKKKK